MINMNNDICYLILSYFDDIQNIDNISAVLNYYGKIEYVNLKDGDLKRKDLHRFKSIYLK